MDKLYIRKCEREIGVKFKPNVYHVVTLHICTNAMPFDIKSRDCQIETVKYLAESGFNIQYSYIGGNAISLLFDKDKPIHHIKNDRFFYETGSVISLLNSLTSGEYSILSEYPACCNCHLYEFISINEVYQYLQYQHKIIGEYVIAKYYDWYHNKDGRPPYAHTTLSRLEYLNRNGLDLNDLPAWQKNGMGISFKWNENSEFTPSVNLDLPINFPHSEMLIQS